MGKTGIRRVALLVIFLSFAFSSISLTEAKQRTGAPLRAVHYMVMELNRGTGIANLVHHQIVSAHVESKTEAEVFAQMAVEDEEKQTFEINVLDNYGESVFRNVAEAPFVLRAEYHGKEGQIDGHFFEVDRSVFVVRVPVEGGKTLQLKNRKNIPGGSKLGAQAMNLAEAATETVATFDLERLAQAKPSAMESLTAAPLSAYTSTVKNRALILIMGDGYTAQEQDKFLVDVQKLKDEFPSITPYKEYANFIDWRILPVVSNQSGADHPPYDPNCNNSSCCSDPEARYDPKAAGNGTYADTAFDSRFCGVPSIHRSLVSNYDKVLTAAAAVPDWDVIWVVVNDPTYGGTTSGKLSTFSTHESIVEVAQHEHGHSFTGLLDEYPEAWCDTRGCYPCEEAKGNCGPNVTNESARSEIKWSPWVSESTPIPTPDLEDWTPPPIAPAPPFPYLNTVGLFQIASGPYRPQYDCAMHSLSAPFCAVCGQEYVLRLYRGWGGVPKDGIDLIEPGSENPPPGNVSISGPITFRVDLLQPVGGLPLEIMWSVDGVQAAVGTNYFSYTPKTSNTKIELRVKDTTILVNPGMAGDVLVSSRTWNISMEVVSAPTLIGPAAGDVAKSYNFTASGSADSLGYSPQYLFDWGDGTNSGWLSVGTTNASKSWATPGVYNVKAQARSTTNANVVSDWSNILSVAITLPERQVVSAPTLIGPATGDVAKSYNFTVSGSADSLGYGPQYLFDWGDGTNSGWLSVGTTSALKSWNTPGVYQVKVQAKSSANTAVVSDWSNILPVAITLPKILLQLSTNQMRVRVANTVTVTATDEAGNKLPGASFHIDGCGQSLVATADEQGIATFKKVKFTAPGQAVVTADMPGFETGKATILVVEKATRKVMTP